MKQDDLLDSSAKNSINDKNCKTILAHPPLMQAEFPLI